MTSVDVGGLWCPECGAEYRPGVAECSDCHVALSSVPPTAEPASVDHEELVYDLAAWTDDQRGALDLLLLGAEIPHGWDGPLLTAPHIREAEIDGFIDEIDAGERVE